MILSPQYINYFNEKIFDRLTKLADFERKNQDLKNKGEKFFSKNPNKLILDPEYSYRFYH